MGLSAVNRLCAWCRRILATPAKVCTECAADAAPVLTEGVCRYCGARTGSRRVCCFNCLRSPQEAPR